ncbi:sulfotransferase family 2 domain-containing protein [Fulvivirgaceae bacterium BMA10]|uniref:Sulfotransferase family 2 domain-containing protein n=1 Tax=Splendidivirga corallicola TaxID=3051826 RepID=A0ABT8KW40_9BACT|nr:sulfotransferase family 2 domain-containing protein [Fulvivirgaceae bacterium BMA10]
MPRISASELTSLIKLILRNGSFKIKPYDYEKVKLEQWRENPLNNLAVDPEKTKRRWGKKLLHLPIIGPSIAFASYYKHQYRWPTFIYHWPERKLAYVRISKCACTSIQSALLQGQYPDEPISLLDTNQINQLGLKFIKPYLEPGYTCFTVVRDPLKRLISCFRDQGQVSNDFYYFNDYIFKVFKPNMSFENFVDVVSRIPDTLKDIHFRPQYKFLERLPGVKVFRIERDKDDLVKFLNDYGLTLPHLNSYHDSDNEIVFGSDTIKKVTEIYKEDYKILNYQKPLLQ